MGPAPEEPEEVQRIREILFGQQARQFEQRLRRLEEGLAEAQQGLTELRALLEHTTAELGRLIETTAARLEQAGLQPLQKQLTEEQKQRLDDVQNLQQQLGDLRGTLEQAMEQLGERQTRLQQAIQAEGRQREQALSRQQARHQADTEHLLQALRLLLQHQQQQLEALQAHLASADE